MSKQLQVAILVAGQDRADLSIEDLWRAAQAAVPSHVELSGTAAYAAQPGAGVLAGLAGLDVLALEIAPEGPAGRVARTLAAKQGPVGVLGRLISHNLSSQRVARALAKNKALTSTFYAADMVVSADPLADWAVWSLRKKTAAPLIHGPFAMANALSEMAQE